MAKYDRLIEIAARVKALREQLRQAEAELEGAVSGAADDGTRTVARSGSAARRIMDVLQGEPARDFDMDTLRTLLPDINGKTLRSTLARLASDDEIDKPKRGVYRARSVATPSNGAAPEAVVSAQ